MKKQVIKIAFVIALTGAFMVASTAASFAAPVDNDGTASGSLAGIWTGTTSVNELAVPFQLELSGSGDAVHGAFVNGKERSASSSGSYSDGHLILHFDYYANTLDATLKDGTLTGTFSGRGHSIQLTALLNGKLPAADANAPHIAGVWDVAVDNGAKGEHSWKLRVRQNGAVLNAVIERIDGDTGNLYGAWRNGAFEVSHFTAAGPSFAVLQPQPDGSLKLETAAHGGGSQAFSAHRVSPIQRVALEGADDPLHHTYLKNPDEPLAFRFPDLRGKLVANTDPQFAHKALIVSIGGSWCPNCQDEAPFLEELYRKYHNRGLEIVELSFEEESQLQNPVRLRAVMQRYGVTYPVLIAGTPDQLNEKIQHVANLNCWPTTFFIGKDGLVKAIHTGYAGPATAEDNRKLQNDITAEVERLLTEKGSSTHVTPIQVAKSQ
jgi:thiol-disulfide isomerase/thioredoxin